ncbi:MAG: C4-type zinc ribbon domain-containing protein [Thermodesulfovibrionales bacterium]|nr:C4-type zinc ribbon domain-containing protein [Thermodesulfovibrionales bacterium]
MNKQLEHLIQLQQIDSKIRAIQRTIEDVPGKITEVESPLQDSQNVLNRIKQQHEAFEKKKREKERALEDINDKINKLKMRTGEIKTNKEYQALLKEIKAVEDARSSIEDDILSAMEDADTLGKQIKTEEQNYRANKEKVETLKKDIENEKSETEKELLKVQGIREKVIEAVDSEVYDQYFMLLEICGGLAVIEVKDEICQGCNMNIPPQLFVELKKNEEIYNCPQCRRIIFYKNSTS